MMRDSFLDTQRTQETEEPFQHTFRSTQKVTPPKSNKKKISEVGSPIDQLREELNRVLNLSEDEKRDRLRCADSEDAPVVKLVADEDEIDCI